MISIYSIILTAVSIKKQVATASYTSKITLRGKSVERSTFLMLEVFDKISVDYFHVRRRFNVFKRKNIWYFDLMKDIL